MYVCLRLPKFNGIIRKAAPHRTLLVHTMTSSRRVAVVTGSNKGIGFAIVRGLCKQFDGDVFLTARDEGRGKKAIEELKKEGLNPLFHQLDISDTSSIQNLHSFLQQQYGGLDILVNNAAIASKVDSPAPFAEQAAVILKVNFWDTLAVCEALFPLLRPHSRVVNVSSIRSATTYKECSDAIKARIRDPNINMDQLKDLIREFEEAAKADKVEERGFRKSAYGTSKLGVRVMSFIQQKELAKDSRTDIIVNSCCPGYVATDMTSHKGTKTIDEGAVTPLYLALLPPNMVSPKGEYLSENTIENWPS